MPKRVKQQINRAALAGHPRYCSICKKMISTSKGKFARHGTTGPYSECPNSGKAVEQAA
jgi:hypothetical protein